MEFLCKGFTNSGLIPTKTHTQEDFCSRLQQLALEEVNLVRQLHESVNSLSDSERTILNNSIIAVRFERQEIEQIVTGAFF
jgi:hypothetical protein